MEQSKIKIYFKSFTYRITSYLFELYIIYSLLKMKLDFKANEKLHFVKDDIINHYNNAWKKRTFIQSLIIKFDFNPIRKKFDFYPISSKVDFYPISIKVTYPVGERWRAVLCWDFPHTGPHRCSGGTLLVPPTCLTWINKTERHFKRTAFFQIIFFKIQSYMHYIYGSKL